MGTEHDDDELDPETRALANEIRDKTVAFVDRHDKEAHDGERCTDARASLIAWLCHSIGVTSELHVEFLTLVASSIEEYDLHHAETHGQGVH